MQFTIYICENIELGLLDMCNDSILQLVDVLAEKYGFDTEEANKFLNTDKKEIKNKVKTTNITKRISTQQAAGIRDFIKKNKDINQPNFTKEDEKQKREIWEYKVGQSAFSDAKEEAKDHIWGKREGIKNYDVSGSDTPWNTIPVTNSENSGTECWKKIPNCKKNLVYDFYNFTLEEIENFDENTRNKYYKLKRWIEYCDKRSAVLCYYGMKEIDNTIKKHFEKQANETNEFIDNLE